MSASTETVSPQPPGRRLDRKLGNILGGRYTADDFVLADAKDSDMGPGLTAVGLTAAARAAEGSDDSRPRAGRYQTREAYLEAMREVVTRGMFDILLASASNGERLTAEGWRNDEVTLVVRANDTSDIWVGRGATYRSSPSRPFRTADLAAIRPFCDLVLYSVTFNNDLERDLATLEAYRTFRLEAAGLGMRHFLEVFPPNAPRDLRPDQVPAFINDSIVRALAGVTAAQRPLFLKMSYNGADALAELAEHDPSLVIGILGGAPGTTRDTFELLHRIEAHGGRVALFGRKIQLAESQFDLVGLMPRLLRGELDPADATREYHALLAHGGITPMRSLEADLELTDPMLLAE